MTPSLAAIEVDLRALEADWSRIAEVPEVPWSMMRIIEHSLDSQQKAEVYVNRLLRYLLDPAVPHGMGDEFLRAFLAGLPEDCGFQEDTRDLSEVGVEDQITVYQTDPEDVSAESPGYADLFIESPNEWFLLVELKFHAGENNLRGPALSQTEAYEAAEYLGGRAKDDFESGEYYVYLRPRYEAEARSPAFANWSWQDLIGGVLEPLLKRNAPRYPNRTVVQLRELIDDLQNLTGMTEHQPDVREKIELYLEHYDAIHDVSEAFEDRWEAFTERWPDRLRESLEADEVDTDVWTFLTQRKDWGALFRDGWWRRQADHEAIYGRIDGPELRVMFVHRLDHHRDDALGDDTLVYYFRNAGANDQSFIDAFDERFDAREAEIDRLLPDRAELTGQRRNLVRAEYPIERDVHDDFFAAYVGALERAFREHAINNEPLVRTLTEIYEDAIGSYE